MKQKINRFYHSYKGQWFIVIVAISFVMFVFLIADRVSLSKQIIAERELNRINDVGMLLTLHIQRLLREHDSLDLRTTLKRSDDEPDIDAVSVMDTTNKVIFSSVSALEGHLNPYPNSADIGSRNDEFYKSFPLMLHGVRYGSIQIGYSLKVIRTELTRSLYKFLVIEFLIFIFLLFAAWYITGMLLKPLTVMKDVSNKIAAGDFSIRAKITTYDIVGELAYALNNMAERLGNLTNNMHMEILKATTDLSLSNKELLKKTEALEESNRKLLELDTLKSDFVSMVSHDLKTPLTSIIGFAKTLSTLDLPVKQRISYLSIIEQEGKRLATLIEKYLDISKMETGNYVLHKEQLDIVDLVRKTVEAIGGAHSLQTVKLIAYCQCCLVYGDADHLQRVLINILDNAFRYNPVEKEVVVTIDEQNGMIVVGIKDNGHGVAAQDRKKIFEKFYRSANGINDRTRGSGLGLAIAKGIIEAHSGKIWVESEEGKGATFKFCLPMIKHEKTEIT
jgi:signal transduction histidine kinase